MRLVTRVLTAWKIADHEAFCSDPGADKEQLVRLAQHASQHRHPLGPRLAANPGMPIDGLLRLTRLYPLEVSINPAFRMRLAIEPAFLRSLTYTVQRRLVRRQGVDVRLIRQLAGPRNRPIGVRAAAARNPGCPMDLLEDYPRHAWPVRAALASNPILPLALQLKLALDPKQEVCLALSVRTPVDPAVLTVLCRPAQHPVVLRAIAHNPFTPDKLLDQLMIWGPTEVKNIINTHRATPEGLALIAKAQKPKPHPSSSHH
jgi:hypothetical protein